MYDKKEGNLALVQRYHTGGLNLIPMCVDGSKKPKVRWKQYIEMRFPGYLIGRYFISKGCPSGIAIICGKTSGNLEVLDFDSPEVFPPWQKKVERHPLLVAHRGDAQSWETRLLPLLDHRR